MYLLHSRIGLATTEAREAGGLNPSSVIFMGAPLQMPGYIDDVSMCLPGP